MWKPRFMGGAFEALIMRDLRAYADANDAEVLYYAESGFEVDAVVEDRDGAWADERSRPTPELVERLGAAVGQELDWASLMQARLGVQLRAA